MNTGTETRTTTISAGDVRKVMSLVTEETRAICEAAAALSRDFDHDKSLLDISVMVLNEVIKAIKLQIYLREELVTEYAYVILDQTAEAYGPPAGKPPLGRLPNGARLRLVVIPNPAVAVVTKDAWFRRLGWSDAKPLALPPGASYITYGAFSSGGFAVERSLLTNPKFDCPVDAADGPHYGKDGRL